MRPNPLFWMVLAAVLGGCASTPPAAPAPAPQARAQDPEPLIQALAALGVDYRYGGKSYDNGFDCSGLVAHVYREAYGVELPHNSLAQSRRGKPVKRDALQMGDLVFYNTQQQPFSHVGIYMGDGRFIHAPKTGAAVRMEKMSSAYWTRRYDGARRIAH